LRLLFGKGTIVFGPAIVIGVSIYIVFVLLICVVVGRGRQACMEGGAAIFAIVLFLEDAGLGMGGGVGAVESGQRHKGWTGGIGVSEVLHLTDIL
jgi:hypothetical protein